MYGNSIQNIVEQSRKRTADKDLETTQKLEPIRRATNYLSGFNAIFRSATKLGKSIEHRNSDIQYSGWSEGEYYPKYVTVRTDRFDQDADLSALIPKIPNI